MLNDVLKRSNSQIAWSVPGTRTSYDMSLSYGVMQIPGVAWQPLVAYGSLVFYE